MATPISENFAQEFSETFRMLQQESGGQLREGVNIDAGISGDSKYYDQFGSLDMDEITNRHGDTEISTFEHERRKLVLTPFDKAVMCDNPDQVRTIFDPTNPYMNALLKSAGRREDLTIVNAFDAAVPTGVAGAGSATFDTTTVVGGHTGFEIASTYGGSAIGLTTEKLTKARAILEGAQNMEDGGEYQWYCVANAKARQDLLDDAKFQDSDYNSIRALVRGEVDTWLGFKFLKSEQLPVSAGDVASIYCWCKQTMQLGVGRNTTGHVDVMPNKRHSTQVRVEMDLGAIRKDEAGVVRILCDQSP